MITHFWEEFKEHWPDYLVLLLGFLIGLAAFIFFGGQKKRLAAFSLALFYFLWGIAHHALKKDFHLKVILEYLLIAILGLSVCFSLFNLP